MPFYEYECQACKFYTEVMQKITDAPLTRCPSCGKRTLKKLMSAPAFRLKGGGWYETDFKSEKDNKRNLVGAEKEESKADVKAEASDAKPAAPEAKDSKAADSKPADSKPADSKPAAPKTAPGGSAGTSTRNRVSVSAKGARAAAARKPTRASRGKGARRRRR
jgi:putative FmdB family regulatory protein